jgi:hypothetical protein
MLPNMQGLLNKGLKNTAVKEDAFPDPENIDRHPLATQTEHTLSKNVMVVAGIRHGWGQSTRRVKRHSGCEDQQPIPPDRLVMERLRRLPSLLWDSYQAPRYQHQHRGVYEW